MRLLITTIVFSATGAALFWLQPFTSPPATQSLVNYSPWLTPANRPSGLALLKKSAAPAIAILTTPVPTTTYSPLIVSFTTASPLPAPSASATAHSTANPTTTNTPPENYAIALITLTTPAKRGSTATLKVVTNVSARCSLTVTLPSGSISGAKDKNTGIKLTDSTNTDSSGYIAWQWLIGSNTITGTANLAIGCSLNRQSYNTNLAMEIIAAN